MTKFEIERHGDRFILVLSGFQHGFLSEDETCAEFSITEDDAKRLEAGVHP